MNNTNVSTENLNLWDNIDIKVEQASATSSSISCLGDVVAGQEYAQDVDIISPSAFSDSVVRASVFIVDSLGNKTAVNVSTNTDFIDGTDGYYYLNKVLSASTTQNFINKVTIPSELTNLDVSKRYNISIVLETLPYGSGVANSVWTSAPTTWLTTYGSGV